MNGIGGGNGAPTNSNDLMANMTEAISLMEQVQATIREQMPESVFAGEPHYELWNVLGGTIAGAQRCQNQIIGLERGS